MARHVLFFTVIAAGLSPTALAQNDPASRFAGRVETDVAALATQPRLAAWQKNHPGNQVQLAHYQTTGDPYDLEFGRNARWCAASVAKSTDGIAGTALFFVPSATRGALPALAQQADSTLTQTCRMEALWYQASGALNIEDVVRALSAAWGGPNGEPGHPSIGGSGWWKKVAAWRRSGTLIWAAYDPSGKPGGVRAPRIVVWARREMEADPDVSLQLLGSDFTTELLKAAGKLAGQDPALTAAMLERSQCQMPGEKPPTEDAGKRILQWLATAKNLPAQGKSAAFLIADASLACQSAPTKRFIEATGAEFKGGCPQDGPAYSHNYRREAEKLDPSGPGGELARLSRLARPCDLKGSRPWPDLVIETGEKNLAQFPNDQWTPWLHYALGRAHAIKLSFSYPGGNPEDWEPILPLSPARKRSERDQAIQHFRQYLEQRPKQPESVFAWQEAWRLLAGLPPTQVSFGCGCE